MAEKIRWGILSTGHISGKFAEALSLLPEAEIRAVASRNAGTAEKFAKEHGYGKPMAPIQSWRMILRLMWSTSELHIHFTWRTA